MPTANNEDAPFVLTAIEGQLDSLLNAPTITAFLGLAVSLSLNDLDITTMPFAENHGYNLKTQFSLGLEIF